MKKIPSEMPRVELWAKLTTLDGKASSEIAAAGANGCLDQRDAQTIYDEDYKTLDATQLARKREVVFRESGGRGHGSVLDQSCFTYVIEDVPRASTLFLCGPQYLSHLQQSLRRANADRGFVLSGDNWNTGKGFSLTEGLESAKGLLEDSFNLYQKMIEKEEIPGEDARYILPLATRTNILTSGDARELMHLHWLSEQPGVPEVTKKVVNEMISQAAKLEPELMKRRADNYEALSWMPSPVLFALTNQSLDALVDMSADGETMLLNWNDFNAVNIRKAVIDRDPAELANLKHMHYTFLAPMSLSSFHQATRQRTWDQTVESVYHAAERGQIIVPPSVRKSKYSSEFTRLGQRMIEVYRELVRKGVPCEEAIGIVPHALNVYDLAHVNGWNAVHSIGKRTCKTAQWEIREIAKAMARDIREVSPELGQYAVPQGITYGHCPERKSCGLCTKYTKE